jgi:hypothetical protein
MRKGPAAYYETGSEDVLKPQASVDSSQQEYTSYYATIVKRQDIWKPNKPPVAAAARHSGTVQPSTVSLAINKEHKGARVDISDASLPY